MQVRTRHAATGVSVSTTEKQNTGRLYARCLLRELGKPDDFEQWVKAVVQEGKDVHGNYPAVGELFGHLLQKAKRGEKWHLPESRYGSSDRDIAQTHPKEIKFALQASFDAVLSGLNARVLERGHLVSYASYKELEKLLSKRRADAVADAGNETKQRKAITLYDNEQLALFESILRCSYAESQHEAGAKADACRKPIDTLTLGIIASVYFAKGSRGMDLDDLKHGYLSITRWNAETWEKVKPLVLQLASGAKGDSANATKHLSQLMHHRDPMRCPIAMLGLYFAYQFFQLQDDLPSLEEWLSEAMHRRPLIRQQTGGGATVTEYNSRLRQDLELIEADMAFTFHCIRDMRIAEAGERGDSQFGIYHGAGHSYGYVIRPSAHTPIRSYAHTLIRPFVPPSDRSHSKSYRATDAPWVLGGAGYSRDPEELAAHVKGLYLIMDLPVGEILVTLLYERWRPELLALEKDAAADKTTAGERMRTWLHMVRHCILAWIVSTAARPRDRFGCILAKCDTKGEIVSSDLSWHMDAIYDTSEYAEMAKLVREYEDQEIGRGDIVQRGGSERRTREDIAALGKKMEDHEVRMTTAAATQASTVITTAASHAANAVLDAAKCQQSMCNECRKPPFLANAHAACRQPLSAEFPALWSADCCVCRTALSSSNSRCREMADALRRGSGDEFMRLWTEWDADKCAIPTVPT